MGRELKKEKISYRNPSDGSRRKSNSGERRDSLGKALRHRTSRTALFEKINKGIRDCGPRPHSVNGAGSDRSE